MMYRIWKKSLPKPARRWVMAQWYNIVASVAGADVLPFLNHGYAAPEGNPETTHLGSADERNRFGIQLYEQITRHADWRGVQALEVSCGHGGGADWMFRAYGPKRLVGLDIAGRSVQTATRHFAQEGLSFIRGDAAALPFSTESVDIVVNVESSLNYPDFSTFLAEVDRILAPGGMLLLADYRSQTKLPTFERDVCALGYQTIWQADLTAGVVRGARATDLERSRLINSRAPAFLRPTLRRFAGLTEEGDLSGRRRFETGQRRYLAFALQKPLDAQSQPINGLTVMNALVTPAAAGAAARLQFRLENHSRIDLTLVGVRSTKTASGAIMAVDGDGSVRKAPELLIKADETLDCKTSRIWLELRDIKEALKDGDTIPFELVFQSGAFLGRAHVHAATH